MCAQVFDNPDQLLQHLLNELQQQPDFARKRLSGKEIDMERLVRQFYTETSPVRGRTRFLEYAVVFLYSNHPADEICSFPNTDEYQEAFEGLRDYRKKHGQTRNKILRCLARFGEHLLLHCIYPMMSRLSRSTPSTGSSQNRPPQLRQKCLERDGHRCVVTGKFDRPTALERHAAAVAWTDDDGNPLPTNEDDFATLQVAHIIPHALGWGESTAADAVNSRLNVLTILEMFIPDTLDAYHGIAMDSPENAMTMEFDKHLMFGELHIYFEPQQGTQDSYTVRHVGASFEPFSNFPRNVTFRTVTGIPSPDPNLFAIHRACARIAHATGAGEACRRFFRDLEDGAVEADGSTPLDHLVAYRLAFHHGEIESQGQVSM